MITISLQMFRFIPTLVNSIKIYVDNASGELALMG